MQPRHGRDQRGERHELHSSFLPSDTHPTAGVQTGLNPWFRLPMAFRWVPYEVSSRTLEGASGKNVSSPCPRWLLPDATRLSQGASGTVGKVVSHRAPSTGEGIKWLFLSPPLSLPYQFRGTGNGRDLCPRHPYIYRADIPLT